MRAAPASKARSDAKSRGGTLNGRGHRVEAVVLGMAVILLATAIVSVGVTGQVPVIAPQLSAVETKLLFRGRRTSGSGTINSSGDRFSRNRATSGGESAADCSAASTQCLHHALVLSADFAA